MGSAYDKVMLALTNHSDGQFHLFNDFLVYWIGVDRGFYITVIFKRLAYTLTAYFCDATGCLVKALPLGQNIVLDKSYTKQLGQISIL